MKKFMFLVMIVSIFSCKSDDNASKEVIEVETERAYESVPGKEGVERPAPKPIVKLPKACDLLKKSTISKYLDVPTGSIRSNEGSPNSQTSSSCFFRWDAADKSNAGVLVQVMTNPIPEELDNWASSFINSKKEIGENVLGMEGPAVFEELNDRGIEGGLYNYEIQKGYWLLDEEVALLLAFNLNIPEKKLKKVVKVFGKEIISTYNKTKKGS